MRHLGHQLALFRSVLDGQRLVDRMKADGTETGAELKEVELQLDIDRDQLRSYSALHAEEIAAEQAAIIEVTSNEMVLENEELREKLRVTQLDRDHWRNQTQERDVWAKENLIYDQQQSYVHAFSEGHGYGHSR